MATDHALAAELGQLRGDLSTALRDLADIKTSCAVLVERSTRTEQDLRDLRQEKDKELAQLRADLEELKDRRWPLGAMGVLSGMAGVVTGAAAFLFR